MNMEHVLRTLTYEFFGAGKHKIPVRELFEMKNAVFLDVRSLPEVESRQLNLEPHIEVVHIPTNEIPDRINEIPHDRTLGIFCTAGTRAAIVYAYLRTKGYENVRIVLGGYQAITSFLLSGKILKQIKSKQIPDSRKSK